MRIFLDVGAHHGETLQEVLKKKYNFDVIYAFEPSKKCLSKLKKYKSKKLIINNFGLGKKFENKELYSPGGLGANVYVNSNNQNTERILIKQASKWFKNNIKNNDIVFVKLNCEGGECDIINDLLINKQFYKIYNIMITFDVRDIPGKEYEELIIRKKLKNYKLNNFCFSDDVMIGNTHKKRIEYWLNKLGAISATKNKNYLTNKYINKLKYYSSKSGFINRLEYKFKKFILYKYYPLLIKNVLKFIKIKTLNYR